MKNTLNHLEAMEKNNSKKNYQGDYIICLLGDFPVSFFIKLLK